MIKVIHFFASIENFTGNFASTVVIVLNLQYCHKIVNLETRAIKVAAETIQFDEDSLKNVFSCFGLFDLLPRKISPKHVADQLLMRVNDFQPRL